ncbi:helix-turn-helix transcriptional regulator [Cohnella silvisoli]|uniref:WYL domain-containing protein n=1 Tax=Cohnella silvisoli TaxID=2873699 RepID=A0ABV1KNT5_9BACL|nr:WYL domain-containing protein [Cohnella silvisoli]MCD9020206.1 WYL domain-containing protein [Cohnella silvisoli]
MARESFDKEIQFLRMLALAGGAYSRQQFAERLGISVHTFDKTLRYLKEIMSTVYQRLPRDQGKELSEGLRYNYYESADPLLLFLFRAKSLKESESIRLSLILTTLQLQSLTAMEVMDACSGSMPDDFSLPDEKTIRGDLKYLEEIGVIVRSESGRPYRYKAANDLVTQLSDEELIDLFDFVDIMANTQVPSVQGYLLRDNLKKALRQRSMDATVTEPFLYKYHYHSRILDEAHLYTIFQAIRQRRKLRFLYLSPKRTKSYSSKNTNPLFERETEGVAEMLLPLRVVYDHQYGRWYLIGHNSRQGIMKFRMEGLTQIEEGDTVPEEEFSHKLANLEEQLRHSWVTDTGRSVRVVARFYNPDRSGANFVKERVLSQGQWGTITEETDSTFLYEITVNGIFEIKPWLRSFGSSCEVIEPASLRREFIAEWKEIQTYYEPLREDL